MERLWRPWRMDWIQAGQPDDGSCPFCISRDEAVKLPGLITAASRLAYATLNLYPYNGGHIMILPYRHVAELTELTEEESADVMAMVMDGVRALRTAMAPGGFNIGVNLGTAAGAGVPGHVHFHVVPRWMGDTNFMPVVGNAKVLPESLETTKGHIVGAWPKRDGDSGG